LTGGDPVSNAENIRVGVRDLKARLSEYLRLVKEGRVVTVTEYGKPISLLVPYSESLQERMQAAVDAGVLVWDRRRWEPSGPVAKVHGRRTVADLIIEDRR
jgi:prevent-host-death family protein